LRKLVLDASVAMSWCFPDESDSYAASVLDALPSSQAVVPWLWPLEIANVLLAGERRGRLSESDTTRFLSMLESLPIVIDRTPPSPVTEDILQLGRRHGLSAYDACYIELARREGLALATIDNQLRIAAEKMGLFIVEP
jgi:predicted nucleic acid-binding protein